MNAFLFLLITDHTRFPNYFTLLTVSHSFSTSTFIMSKINIIYAIFGIFYLFSYKKRAASIAALFLFAWQRPTLARDKPSLPSALKSLTSVFGMGTGVTSSPLPPSNFFLFIVPFSSMDNYYYNFLIAVVNTFLNIILSKLDNGSFTNRCSFLVKSSID